MNDLTALGMASEVYKEYKYIGHRDASGHPSQFVMGIPARDLYPADIISMMQNQGVTRHDIEVSGIYEPVNLAEIAPMCGATLQDGGTCKRAVESWGRRCWQHKTD